MSWRPGADVATARARAAMLDHVREHFRDAGVLEICTPLLGGESVTDPNVESIPCETTAGRAYLQPSPEYFMKRLLAADYPDIYQVGPAFRDGENGRRHATEFTMVEWYRRGFDLRQIIDDAVTLSRRLIRKHRLNGVDDIRYSAAFEQHLALDPLTAGTADVADAVGADAALRAAIGDDRDAWLDLALATRVAPLFPGNRLTVLHHFPASQSALARLDPDTPDVAERFELFVGSVEIANGFVELTDAGEQRRRFDEDRRKRRSAGQTVPAVDEMFLQALESGLPECAGVALGLDRVLMIDEGFDDIRQVQSFSPGRQE
jgi:lysyl-tRNA synthetase class 2